MDDVPAVAVTLNTNDFGSVQTLALLAQVPPTKLAMNDSADDITGNLVSGDTYLHGVTMADFAVVCGNLPGITMWAPVQDECDIGTLANNIDQTLFLDKVFINSLELSYTTGANATENYGAETDNKMWLLNEGAYVNYLDSTVSGVDISSTYMDLVAMGFDPTSTIPVLSTGNLAFLRKTKDGATAVTLYDASENEMVNVAVVAGSSQAADEFVFDAPASRLYVPSDLDIEEGDILQVVFAADKYSAPMNTYFEPLVTGANSDVGALRQGQIEVYIINGSTPSAMWRLTGCTISADLTREPLLELGHLAPYDRPLTLPIPITVTIDSTAGDLENWAKLAGQDFETITDIDLSDLMGKDDLILMVKVYEQTDEEAGGTGLNRKVLTDGALGDTYFADGVMGTYSETVQIPAEREYALKTIVVKNLKITDEGMTLDVGANATQTFGFRASNDLYVIKGDLSADLAAGIMRNSM